MSIFHNILPSRASRLWNVLFMRWDHFSFTHSTPLAYWFGWNDTIRAHFLHFLTICKYQPPQNYWRSRMEVLYASSSLSPILVLKTASWSLHIWYIWTIQLYIIHRVCYNQVFNPNRCTAHSPTLITAPIASRRLFWLPDIYHVIYDLELTIYDIYPG